MSEVEPEAAIKLTYVFFNACSCALIPSPATPFTSGIPFTDW